MEKYVKFSPLSDWFANIGKELAHFFDGAAGGGVFVRENDHMRPSAELVDHDENVSAPHLSHICVNLFERPGGELARFQGFCRVGWQAFEALLVA